MSLSIRSMRDVMKMVGAAYDAAGIVLTPNDVDHRVIRFVPTRADAETWISG